MKPKPASKRWCVIVYDGTGRVLKQDRVKAADREGADALGRQICAAVSGESFVISEPPPKKKHDETPKADPGTQAPSY